MNDNFQDDANPGSAMESMDSMDSMDSMNGMIDCESVMRQLWDYLDGQLTTETMRAIHVHLDQCQKCRPQADFRRAFERAVSSAREDVGNTDALRDRIRLALRNADTPNE